MAYFFCPFNCEWNAFIFPSQTHSSLILIYARSSVTIQMSSIFIYQLLKGKSYDFSRTLRIRSDLKTGLS